MTKTSLIGIVFLFSLGAWGSDVYYLNNLKHCEIKILNQGRLEIVDPSPFVNTILQVRKLPKNPNMMAFKQEGRIYVTPEYCVVSADSQKVTNRMTGYEFKKEERFLSTAQKFRANKYFAEVELGSIRMMGQGPVVGDYNSVFPSTSTTDPTQWGSASEGSYKSGMLLSFGGGFKRDEGRYYAFKIRLFNGKISDTLALTDLNTGISQQGSWTYEDSFKNFYIGHKWLFDYGAWKPVAALYAGVSLMSSTLSDGLSTYELQGGISPAVLAELGLEYHLNEHWGLGFLGGLEYIGKKTLKFSDQSAGSDIKTNMSYTNNYFSLGLKYYFK